MCLKYGHTLNILQKNTQMVNTQSDFLCADYGFFLDSKFYQIAPYFKAVVCPGNKIHSYAFHHSKSIDSAAIFCVEIIHIRLRMPFLIKHSKNILSAHICL